jgi:hypothetical protein
MHAPKETTMKKTGEMTMKNFATPIKVRAVVAAALCFSFIFYPQLRLSSVQAAAGIAADVKSESQLRSEASRYDAAIRAIGGIATMKFNTPEDIKNAVVVLNRERPNLRFHRSKFVLIGISDSAFVSALRRKFPTKAAAETFGKQLTADTKLANTVDGAEALKTRIRQSIESDTATLRRAADRLREAAARFKRAQLSPAPGSTGAFRVLRAGFMESPEMSALTETPGMPTIDPLSIVIIVVAIIGYSLIIYQGLRWFGPYYGIGTEEDKDQVADCQNATDTRYNQCVAEAQDLPSGFPFFVREVAVAACYADWLARQAACLTLYI